MYSKNGIPFGPYCYYGSYVCPFWKLIKGFDDNGDACTIGMCRFYKVSDDDFSMLDGLLWDQVKCTQCMEENCGEDEE